MPASLPSFQNLTQLFSLKARYFTMRMKTWPKFAYIMSSFMYVPAHISHGLQTSCARFFVVVLHLPSLDSISFITILPRTVQPCFEIPA